METHYHNGLLIPHPDTPANAIESISCGIIFCHDGKAALDFIVGADPAVLKLAPACAPERCDGLWQNTCFELFVRSGDESCYREYNFAPSGAWAAYHFDGYRIGMKPLETAPPRILTSNKEQFDMAMAVDLARRGLEPAMIEAMLAAECGDWPRQATQFPMSIQLDGLCSHNVSQLHIALSAVIEEVDGTKSYWALRHPPGPPDFHHPDCFALTLGPPDKS